jgi:pimeloyl-ACP methyl ester carboxylesterase
MSYVHLPSGVDMFFTDDGDRDAPALLFVHGWTCDSYDWSWQLPHFADRYRLIAVDIRGHGRSSAPSTGYAIADFARDVSELVDHLGVDRLIGIGHSMGGMILSDLAISRPGLIRALALVEPAYGSDDDLLGQVAAALPAMRGPDGFDILIGQIQALETPQTPAGLRTWHTRRLRGMSQDVAVAAFDGMMSADHAWATRARSEARLAGRDCPVLSLYCAARAECADWERAFDANTETGVVDGGHWIHQERPDEVNDRLDTWLATIPATPPR